VSNWIDPLREGSPHEMAVDTSTEYRYVSVCDRAIDREQSPKNEHGELRYADTRDEVDLVLRYEQTPDGERWGPCWFYVRAVSAVELESIRARLPRDADPRERADRLCRELFRIGVTRVAGMWVFARDQRGKLVTYPGTEEPRRRTVLLERQSTVGGYDRMTDEFYRRFDSPMGDRTRMEIGYLVHELSVMRPEHLGNSSARTSSGAAPSEPGA
jgi:hypothetical protein